MPLKKAMDWLIARSAESYNKDCGHCARFVREAVEFALAPKALERKISAKDYGSSYEKLGFKEVFSSPEQDRKNYQPKAGDIAIIEYEPHGHICMFCEGIHPRTGKTYSGWISDFKQRDLYGGKIRESNPPFKIYRYE